MDALRGSPRSGILPADPVAQLRFALSDASTCMLLTVCVLGQILDVVTTRIALASGQFDEANPVFAGAITEHPTVAIIAKLAISTGVLATALLLLSRAGRMTVLIGVALISVAVPLDNALKLLGLI